jgi:hypothetical protein
MFFDEIHCTFLTDVKKYLTKKSFIEIFSRFFKDLRKIVKFTEILMNCDEIFLKLQVLVKLFLKLLK